VAIGSKERLAGHPEAFLVDSMTDAVARLRIPHPEALAHAAQKEVIFSVL
jgi:hypothetical protein